MSLDPTRSRPKYHTPGQRTSRTLVSTIFEEDRPLPEPNLFQKLPVEVLTNVLSFLPGIDLESCKLVNRDVRDIISGSSLLRYLMAADLAGVEDNPQSRLSLSAKLAALTNRELLWRKFEPYFIRSVLITHPTSGTHDLASGVYVTGVLNQPWLHYFELPTIPSQATASWSRIQAEPHHTIIDFALATSESDLIAIITSAPYPNLPAMFCIELSFRSVKNGKAHPLAERSAIPIELSSRPKPDIAIEIVGDMVALTVAHYEGAPRRSDQVLVWNWKTGASLMSIDATYGTHPNVRFLTGNTLLVPNTTTATFELWRIPSSTDNISSNPIRALSLPPLAPGMQISRISCLHKLNPLGSCFTPNFNRLFRASPQQAIIVFHIYINSIPTGPRFVLALVVHRHSLVDLIHEHPQQSSPEGIRQPLPWTEWGPSSTRLFVSGDSHPQRTAASAGQRLVFISYTAARSPSPIITYDFNPHNVAKMRNYLEHHPNRDMFCNERDEELERVPRIFEGPVRSALPYCCSRTEKLYTYTNILIDEETLLVTKSGSFGRVGSIDIMRF